MGPDFSDVDSLAKAKQLTAEGVLEALLLLPAKFGGSPAPENVVYVPAWFARQKDEFDSNIVGPLVAEGEVTRYRAVPQYQGSSFVPISIKIDAWDPARISADLILWGDALRSSQTPLK